MKVIAYALTTLSALLVAGALVSICLGYVHQLWMLFIGLLMMLTGIRSIKEEEEAHDGR